jgi:hypothetical protein
MQLAGQSAPPKYWRVKDHFFRFAAFFFLATFAVFFFGADFALFRAATVFRAAAVADFFSFAVVFRAD